MFVIFPECGLLGVFQAERSRQLCRACSGKAQDDVGSLDVFDQILIADGISNPPACRTERFANRPYGNCDTCKSRIKSSNAREGFHITKTLIDFVRENDHSILDADVANSGQFLNRKNFPEWIVAKRPAAGQRECDEDSQVSLRGVQYLRLMSMIYDPTV